MLLIIPALIGGGLGLLGGVFGSLSQRGAEQRDRKHQEMMYQRQYDDNINFWEKQNAYNTPSAQMQRLKDAGLNPALMYGQGASAGNSGAITTPTTNNPTARAQDYSWVGGLMNQFQDVKLKQAQTDNVKKATQLTIKDTLLRHQDTGLRSAQKFLTRNQGTKLVKELAYHDQFLENRNRLQLQDYNTKEIGFDIKGIERDFLKSGIHKGDPVGYRIFMSLLKAMGKSKAGTDNTAPKWR